jgi:hypothetical protein
MKYIEVNCNNRKIEKKDGKIAQSMQLLCLSTA